MATLRASGASDTRARRPEPASPGRAQAAGPTLWVALGIVYLVWGSTYLAIRVAVETLPPFLMASTRFLIAGGALFVWAARRGDVEGDPIGIPQWKAAALVGGLLLLGGNGSVVWAEQFVPTGVAALIIATIPLWMALIASRIRRERIRPATILGLGLGLVGTTLLVRSVGSGGGSVHAGGIAVLCFAAISWSLGSVLSRHVPLPSRPSVGTAMEMLCGGLGLGILGLVSGEAGDIHLDQISLASTLGLIYLIVFGSLIAFSAYVWLLANASTSVVSTYAYVNPVIAVFLGWSILDERVTGLTLVAAALIVGAVVLIMNTESRKRRDAAAMASPCDAPVSRDDRTSR